MKKIFFIAPPFSGHLYPQINLANMIKDKYQIKFISGYSKEKVLKERGFDTFSVLKHKPYAIDKIANSDKSISNNPIKLYKQFKENMSLLKEIIEELDELCQREKPDLIIADFVAPHGGIIGDKYNIPWITTIPTPFAIENIDGTPSYAGGLKPLNNSFGKTRDSFYRFFIHNIKSTFAFLAKSYIKDYLKNIYRDDGTEVIYSPYSILALGIKELEFERTWPKPLVWLGPSLDKEDSQKEIDLDFDRFEKNIFITFGTHLEWAKDKYIEEIKNLAEKLPNYFFVLSLGGSKGVEGFVSDNFRVINYLSYDKHLQNFDLVIHHGGAGILYHTLNKKLPSIVIPQDYDQFDYSARLEYYSLGLKAKSFGEKNLVKKIEFLLMGSYDKNIDTYKKYIDSYKQKEIFIGEIERLIGD